MKLVLTAVLAFQCCLSSLSAQQGPSPLVGKTILVYNPAPGESLYVDISGSGLLMRAVPGNWMVLTLPVTVPDWVKEFGIRTSYGVGSFWVTKTGVGQTGASAFSAADFAGGDSLWIIIDPAGPATAPPYLLTQAPKVINILNPWEATAPAVVLPGPDKRMMRTLPDHCGWFTSFLFKPADMQVFFEEIGGARQYGKDGMGTGTPFDLAALFAAHPAATTLWLDTDRNTWLPEFPGKLGHCRYLLAATVRDFSQAHPDFTFAEAGQTVLEGMVEDALGVTGGDREPVRSTKASPTPIYNQFKSWWNTDSTHANPELRSYATCVDLPMAKTHDGSWEFDSESDGSRGFFPVETFANPNNERTAACSNGPDYAMIGTRNLNFCTEVHATFVYKKGQRIEYRADDDAWLFINDRLVMDLGGLHSPVPDTVDLDRLGLTEGAEYTWDLFHCERQPCAASLRIKASMVLQQQRSLFLERDSGTSAPGRFRIMKGGGGTGSCAGVDTASAPPAPATSLVYQLWDAQGAVIDTLAEGGHYGGGILIATPSVFVDTAKLSGSLPRGAYRLVAFEPGKPSIRVEIPIQIGPVSTALRAGAKVHTRVDKRRPMDALGRARPGRVVTFRK